MLAKGIEELARELKEGGYHITIETAGTIEPDGIACDLASVSPKLADSTPAEEQFGEGWSKRHEEGRIQLEVLSAWSAGYECQFKFVVSETAQMSEIDDLLSRSALLLPLTRSSLCRKGRILGRSRPVGRKLWSCVNALDTAFVPVYILTCSETRGEPDRAYALPYL